MARPSKEPLERRDQRFNLRYTLAEIEHIRAQAHAAGLDPHEYARRRTLGHNVPPAPSRPGVNSGLVSELNRIGVNVNQLARAANRGSDFTAHWREVGTELRTVLAHLVGGHGS